MIHPNKLSGCMVALDAGSLYGAEGEKIGAWSDESGHGRHFTTTVESEKPTYRKDPLGLGLASLEFNGSGRLYGDLTWLVGSPYTIVASVARTSNRTVNYFLGTGTSVTNQGLHFGWRSNGTFTLAQYSNDLDWSVPTYLAPTMETFTGVFGPLGHAGYFQGKERRVNYNTSGFTNAASGRIGTSHSGVGPGSYYGHIFKLALFNRELSLEEIQQVESWAVSPFAEQIKYWGRYRLRGTTGWATAFRDATDVVGDGLLTHPWDKSALIQGEYEWQVGAYTELRDTPVWSPTRTFTANYGSANNPPSIPVVLTPDEGSTESDDTFEVSWTASIDPDA